MDEKQEIERYAPGWDDHWLRDRSAKIARVMALPAGLEKTPENEAVYTSVSELMIAGGERTYPLMPDTLMAFLSTAYGCHEAARKLHAQGNHTFAEMRSSMGQLFMLFVADHIADAGAAIIAANTPTQHDTRH